MSRVVIVHQVHGIYKYCEADTAHFCAPENFKYDDVAAAFSSRDFAERFIKSWGIFPDISEFDFVPVDSPEEFADISDLHWAGVISPQQYAMAERTATKAILH